MENAGYKKLNVYIKGHQLSLLVYKLSRGFPRDEIFGLTSQMRRCSVSVVANLVEGYGRRTANDKLQFYYISRGSLTELEYYIDLSFDLGYINSKEYEQLQKLREETGRLLSGFIKSIK